MAADRLTPWAIRQQEKAGRREVCGVLRAGVGLPSLWEPLKGQIYLGPDEFVESMLAEGRLRPGARRGAPGSAAARATPVGVF